MLEEGEGDVLGDVLIELVEVMVREGVPLAQGELL